ncbi:hypothetical protein [Floridanema aerugineum]|uniref:Uncharacterized protein n=1 Tax=Floridaenema aerugineum BLCC-F46 TaxID=3153654 RepID=A0ABV4X8E0_9CYAN
MKFQSTCEACKARVNWVKTPNGKYTPINLDGSTHWATCPDAKRFKKK